MCRPSDKAPGGEGRLTPKVVGMNINEIETTKQKDIAIKHIKELRKLGLNTIGDRIEMGLEK